MIEVDEAPAPGVNLIGFLHGELGLGEIARKLARVLQLTEIPFAAISYDRTPSRQEHPFELETSTRVAFDTNIVCVQADAVPRFAQDVGLEVFAGRYTIGVWFWDTSVFREQDRRAFYFFDEIWAPSAYVREALEREANIPVLEFPVPFAPPLEPALSREEVGLPPGFVFLFLFDFVSADRKNPLGLVDAFSRAFEPGEGPTLVLKTINARERKPRQLEELRAAIAGRSDIVLLDGYVSVAERDAIVAASDCYVSLHRSEGFGLTMAEAVSYGKPVIATGYSGNLEFTTEANSYLVPYRLVDVPREWWAHAPGAVWADPDLDAAAALMRRVWERPEEARARGARAREELFQRLSPTRTASFVAERLDATRARLPDAGRPSALEARRPIVETLLASSRLAETLASDESLRPTSLVRRVLHRALWPYFEEQRRVERSVVDALGALQRSQSELEARLRRVEHAGSGDGTAGQASANRVTGSSSSASPE